MKSDFKQSKQVRVCLPNSLLYSIAKQNKSLSAFIKDACERALEEE